MSRKISLCATAAALVLETLAASAEEPVLRIAKQGSMEAGGKTINCATNDGGDANSTRWPSGHVVIDQVYASFQYPADHRYPYPILFNSGGGHTESKLSKHLADEAAAPPTTELEIVTSTSRFTMRDIPPEAAKTLKAFAAQALNFDATPVWLARPAGSA